MTVFAEAGALALAIRRLSRELSFVARDLESVVPLTFTESYVMGYVDRTPGITSAQIAERGRLKRSNVSSAVSLLESKGFLRRERDSADRRVIKLFPTQRSETNLAMLLDAWSAALIGVLEEGEIGKLEEAAALIESISDRLAPAT